MSGIRCGSSFILSHDYPIFHFTPLNILHFLIKLVNHMCLGLFLDPQLCSIGLLCLYLFFANTIQF